MQKHEPAGGVALQRAAVLRGHFSQDFFPHLLRGGPRRRLVAHVSSISCVIVSLESLTEPRTSPGRATARAVVLAASLPRVRHVSLAIRNAVSRSTSHSGSGRPEIMRNRCTS